MSGPQPRILCRNSNFKWSKTNSLNLPRDSKERKPGMKELQMILDIIIVFYYSHSRMRG